MHPQIRQLNDRLDEIEREIGMMALGMIDDTGFLWLVNEKQEIRDQRRRLWETMEVQA